MRLAARAAGLTVLATVVLGAGCGGSDGDPSSADPDDGWEYALGALSWLLWVTGASDHMSYPQDRARLRHR